MVNPLLIAVAVMIGATLASHLGLFESVAKIALKIAGCNMCSTFWLTLIILIILGTPVIIAPLYAITMAYISNWFVLLLIQLQVIYDRLWQKINRKQQK